MKKISMLLVLAAVSFSFVACSGGKTTEGTEKDSVAAEAPTTPDAPETEAPALDAEAPAADTPAETPAEAPAAE